jgi:hypothetical protein
MRRLGLRRRRREKSNKGEFFEAIYSGRLNVHPNPEGTYPYTSVWKYLDYGKYGQVFGKSVGILGEGKSLPITEYYLND